MSKQLVVCCDGTGDVPDQRPTGVASPTNVAKLTLGLQIGDGAGFWGHEHRALIYPFRGGQVAPPKIFYQPPAPDVDEDGLKWEKLGFVVIDVDGPGGQAVYVDEDGAEVSIAAFGREAGAGGEPVALR